MTYISRLIAFIILSLFFSMTNQGQSAVEKNRPLSKLSGEHISGVWLLNESESDDLFETLQSLFQKVRNRNIAQRSVETDSYLSPPISFSLMPPDRLVIATDAINRSVTINEGFLKKISTRTVLNDGRKHLFNISEGAQGTVSAIHFGDFVKIETVSPRANKMTETYVVNSNGKKLAVDFRFETETKKEIFSLHRVYDRAKLNPLLSEPGEIQ